MQRRKYVAVTLWIRKSWSEEEYLGSGKAHFSEMRTRCAKPQKRKTEWDGDGNRSSRYGDMACLVGSVDGVRDRSDFEDSLQRVAEKLKMHMSNEMHPKFWVGQ